jgi:hypothetical protein
MRFDGAPQYMVFHESLQAAAAWENKKNVLQKKLGSGIKNVLFGRVGLRARLTSRRNIQMISGCKA